MYPRLRFPVALATALAIQFSGFAATNADQISLAATADTSVFSNMQNNNGGGHTFGVAGVTQGGNVRNMLLLFDLSGIAPGSTIDSVSLDFDILQIGQTGGTYELFQVDSAWGEGSGIGNQGSGASAGDATWLDSQFGSTPWSTPGGSFFAPVLDDVTATTTGLTTFDSSSNFTSAVQAIVDNPSLNFGFLISSSDAASAIRIGSREGGSAAVLNVEFTPIPEPASSTILMMGVAVLGLRRSRK